LFAAVIAAIAGSRGAARAETHGVFRLGVEPLGLDPSDDTPYVGQYIGDAIDAYNAAGTAYNRAHGYNASSAMAVAPIDRSDLALHTTLVTFAPGLEIRGDHAGFRVEGLFGVSGSVRAYGVGVYPLDIAVPLRNGQVVPYVLGGASLRWLDSTNTDGEIGALATFRLAGGAHLARRFNVELGVSLYAVGGFYNKRELETMSSYDPRGNAPPPPADHVAAGGTQSGMIDISVGFVL
jgi:hypothetical protein